MKIRDHPDFPTWDADEQAAAIAQEEAEESAARDVWIAAAADAARNAVSWNATTRATLAARRTALLAFAGGTAPAGTVAEQLAWLYARSKEMAGVMAELCAVSAGILTEADGLIDLFRTVIPAVDTLFDGGIP